MSFQALWYHISKLSWVLVNSLKMGLVKIRVLDEGRGVEQDFSCEMTTLLSSMRYPALNLMLLLFPPIVCRCLEVSLYANLRRYFKSYLKKVSLTQNVEISVHCDVMVFGWLLQYAKAARGSAEPPELDFSNCIPILISSHFLQVHNFLSKFILHS